MSRLITGGLMAIGAAYCLTALVRFYIDYLGAIF